MPFIAINKETGGRVDITREGPEYIATFKVGSVKCQLCGGEMFPRSSHSRQGHTVRAHFRHARAECDHGFADYEGGTGESDFHREGKVYVATEWLLQFGRYKTSTIDYEVIIECGERRRIADVLVTLPNGHRIAHEIQLAAITPRELEERSNDYASAGVDVYWHIGRSADTEANRQYLSSMPGDYSLIVFTESFQRAA